MDCDRREKKRKIDWSGNEVVADKRQTLALSGFQTGTRGSGFRRAVSKCVGQRVGWRCYADLEATADVPVRDGGGGV